MKIIQVVRGMLRLINMPYERRCCMCKDKIPRDTWYVKTTKEYHIDCFRKEIETPLDGQIKKAMKKAIARQL